MISQRASEVRGPLARVSSSERLSDAALLGASALLHRLFRFVAVFVDTWGMTALLRILATFAARWRMPIVLMAIRMMRPQSLVSRNAWQGPLMESVCGGSMGCLRVLLEGGQTHSERAIWAAAGQCFYSERWELLEYFVRHYGEDVLRDHTVTAWLHVIEATDIPPRQRELLLTTWQSTDAASLALWLPHRGVVD